MTPRRRAPATQVPVTFAPLLPADLEAIASLPDELARLEGWAAVRGYELIYMAEDVTRVSMARRTT